MTVRGERKKKEGELERSKLGESIRLLPSDSHHLDMLSSFLSYLYPTPVLPRITILDLPFEILEEILSIVLLLPSPPNSFSSSSSSVTACLQACKAFNSAGEKQLFRSVSVSRESSWRMLFGPEGLFSREGGRNLARFVHELSLGGSTHWLWQLSSSSDGEFHRDASPSDHTR